MGLHCLRPWFASNCLTSYRKGSELSAEQHSAFDCCLIIICTVNECMQQRATIRYAPSLWKCCCCCCCIDRDIIQNTMNIQLCSLYYYFLSDEIHTSTAAINDLNNPCRGKSVRYFPAKVLLCLLITNQMCDNFRKRSIINLIEGVATILGS